MLNLPQFTIEEFRNIFGIREDGSRKNKILLACYRNKALRLSGFLRGITSMVELEQHVLDAVENNPNGAYEVRLLGRVFRSNVYETDDHEGITDAKEPTQVRFRKHEPDGRIREAMKNKSGKLLRALIGETEIGSILPEQVYIYMCEQFALQWSAHVEELFPEFRLIVDKNFKRIYSRTDLLGDFGSCMTGAGRHAFYDNCVNASAAYLLNRDDMVVARAVLFEDVCDVDTGEHVRLLERQYASDKSEKLKRLLVNKLIAAGRIDGYKQIGAGCSENRNFVSKDGESWAHRKFSISCTFQIGGNGPRGKLSYQDSFTYYRKVEGKAFNFTCPMPFYRLNTTASYLTEHNRYGAAEPLMDTYHNRRTTSPLVEVHRGGQSYMCATDDLGDFEFIDQLHGYYHRDDVRFCPRCMRFFAEGAGQAVFSELTETWYDCPECKEKGELQYKEDWMFYSKKLNQWFESEDDLEEAEKNFRSAV